MCEERDLDNTTRAQIDAFVRGLEQWLCGDLAWYARTHRYTGSGPGTDAPGRGCTAAGPVGLGTYAARPRGMGNTALP